MKPRKLIMFLIVTVATVTSIFVQPMGAGAQRPVRADATAGEVEARASSQGLRKSKVLHVLSG